MTVMKIYALWVFPDKRTKQIEEATRSDDAMQCLLIVIKDGQPTRKRDVPLEVKGYFEMRDALSFEEGVILKGELATIPLIMRNEMTARGTIF